MTNHDELLTRADKRLRSNDLHAHGDLALIAALRAALATRPDPLFEATLFRNDPGWDVLIHDPHEAAALRRSDGRRVVVYPTVDREPQPDDGPEYHADHAAWETRAVAGSATPEEEDT